MAHKMVLHYEGMDTQRPTEIAEDQFCLDNFTY